MSSRGVGVGTKTVLFSDVVDSTATRAALGDHDADVLDQELRRVHERAIDSSSGELVKGLGDGYMAVFDSAADAITAAVELQIRVREQNRRRDAEVGLRVGVSTGDVHMTDDDYFGTPVVEAARLCTVAEGGDIIVSEVVRLLAGSRASAQLADRGMLELKGLPAPVHAWQVVWDEVAVEAPELPPGLTVNDDFAFVGRAREWKRMEDAWKRACAGRIGMLLVTGEPGAGKTRLTAEFARTVRDGGATILYGSCEDGLAVPYQPFVEALRQLLSASMQPRLGTHPEELTRLVPEIEMRIPGLPEPVSSDPETERYQLFNALVDCIADVAVDEPVLLVLDDLHWATKPTLQLLRHLVRSNVAAPVLVLTTFRDTELDATAPLVEALADVERLDTVERLTLAGLDTTAIREYLDHIAGYVLDERADVLAEQLHRETNGNPFFVREMLLYLVETGQIYRDGERWEINRDFFTAVPVGARDVITRRLARLTDDTQMLLSRAAVVGLDFRMPVLVDVTEMHEDVLLDGLEQASAARLVEELELDHYRFTHALVRAALLDGISVSRRARIHRRVAETLERQAAIQLDLVEELAEHWAAAGDAGDASKALMYTRLAAQRASDQLAYDEAVVLFTRALGIARSAGESETVEAGLLADLGAAQQRAGDPDHRGTLLEAGRLARRCHATDVMVQATLDNARTAAVLEVDPERVDLLEAALDATEGAETSERARVLACLSYELSFTPERERGMQLSDESVRVARAVGSLSDLAFVLSMRVNTFRSPDTLAERREISTEIEKVSVELDDPGLRFLAAFRRAEVLMDAGDIDGFTTVVDTMESLTARLRQPMMVWNTARRMAERELLAGRLDAAARLAEQVRVLGRELRLEYADPIHVALTAKIFEAQGAFDDAAALWEPWVDRIHLIGFRFGLAHALARGGRRDEAERQWQLGTVDELADVDRGPQWLETMGLAAEVAYLVDDAQRGRFLREVLAPYAGHIITAGVGAVSATEHALGVAAMVAGDLDDAVIQLERASHIGESIGAPLLHAMSLTRLGAARLTRRVGSDVTMARDELARARDVADAHAARGISGEAEALLATP